MKNRIRELRKERGWSLEVLADKANASFAQIQKLETGQRRLSTVWMERLGKAFGVNPLEIISEGTTADEMVAITHKLNALSFIEPLVHTESVPPSPNGAKTEVAICSGPAGELNAGDYFHFSGFLPGVPQEYLNKVCLVELADGTIFCGRVQKGSAVGHFTLESFAKSGKDMQNTLVKASAKVEAFVVR